MELAGGLGAHSVRDAFRDDDGQSSTAIARNAASLIDDRQTTLRLSA